MIEHDIDFISKLCDPVIVMAEGSVLMTDTISQVRQNEKVIEVYLGKN
jgi:branched-chain amino acid transport system ATP-binding protein